ncbi:MAG: hypothetical protein AAFO57_00250 [Pseudomonadota bacterium]
MDKIDLNDAADTLRAYEEQREKRARSNIQRAPEGVVRDLNGGLLRVMPQIEDRAPTLLERKA